MFSTQAVEGNPGSFLLLGYYGSGNFGDELLLANAVRLLRESWEQVRREHSSQTAEASLEIGILSADPALTQRAFPDCRVIHRFDPGAVIAALRQYRYLLIAGGSLFQDRSSWRSVGYYAGICALGKLFGQRLLFLSQGVGPLGSALGKSLSRYSFQQADFVSLREGSYSADLLTDWAVPFEQAADLAWCYPPQSWTEPLERKTKEAYHVLVSLRPDPRLTPQGLAQVAAFLQKNFPQKECKLLALQERDREVLEPLQFMLCSRSVGCELILLNSPAQWADCGQLLFSKSAFALVMRFHAMLLCLQHQIPSLGLSYDPKVEALCQAAGVPWLPLEEVTELENFRWGSYSFVQSPSFVPRQRSLAKEVNGRYLRSIFESALGGS